jgi:uncharacterized HhH-GPD family protein
MGLTMNNERRVTRCLLRYGKSLHGGAYTGHKAANQLVSNNSTAFLFGVIFDQGIPFEKAWAAPYQLKQRLGHLNVAKIARAPVARLRLAIRGTKTQEALHRFTKKLPIWLKQTSRMLVADYDGDASNIWNKCLSAGEVIERLDDFPGIGPKKANMAARLLHEGEWCRLRRWNEINVAADVHVKRVWKRAGLVRNPSVSNIMQKAIELHAEYPAELDYPTWTIGTEWCHAKRPDCSGKKATAGRACPLIRCCPGANA